MLRLRNCGWVCVSAEQGMVDVSFPYQDPSDYLIREQGSAGVGCILQVAVLQRMCLPRLLVVRQRVFDIARAALKSPAS